MTAIDGSTLDAGALTPTQEATSRSRSAALALLFVAAVAVTAYIAIPIPLSPVPVTLQVLVVILAGAVLGPRLGAAAMAGYLALGAVGAPVFSFGAAGFPMLAGPTGGYLLAFPLSAAVVGLMAGSPEASALRTTWALMLGVAVIYLGGVCQLGLLTGQPIGELLAVGVAPFLVGDVAKVLIALAVLLGLRRNRGR